VFCCSLADVFDNKADPQWRSDLFQMIEDTPALDWLLLTKRPQNIAGMLWPKWDAKLPDNIWLGTTVENRQEADRRIPALLGIPARIHFVSCEPLLERIHLGYIGWPSGSPRKRDGTNALLGITYYDGDFRGRTARLGWVICGGESGGHARVMNPDWARSLRDQCEAASVPFFMKQMTKKAPIPPDLMVRQFPVTK
jgi:protein gp37